MSKNNEPAFPALDCSCGELSLLYTGIKLRDYFAAMAMQGDWTVKFNESEWLAPGTEDETLSRAATLYYRMADAMLEVRKAGKEAA